MRKLNYAIPADKLVVVLADFSSGNPDEGREIADEIAHQLSFLKESAGIDVHVLAGEIKPGVVIRSEEMAQDVGRHFPAGTDYVVIWGTMSPRTVGKYRPHLTCVHKAGPDRGVASTVGVNLDAQDLPLPVDPAAYQRACYERLIGVTCAAVPQCYAAHLISQELTPDLRESYKLFEDATPGVKEQVQKLKDRLAALTLWPAALAAHKLTFLHGLSAISSKYPYPLMILDDIDGSLLLLITDEQGRAKKFTQSDGHEAIVYIDMLETTNRQFIKFLNSKGEDKTEGGVKWIRLEEDFRDIEEAATGKFSVAYPDRARDAAVFNVSWFGARAYCDWAGKVLPTLEEWQAAAKPNDGTLYPWGDTFNGLFCNSGLVDDQDKRFCKRGGIFETDRSRIGCFDMAGNLAEWCFEYHNEKMAERKVCGGSYLDKGKDEFSIQSVRGHPQTSPERWIGFRGVIRIPIKKQPG
ncbi:MAG TPA: SUMF1/EgtB/PvdO family nonheme iron enzyme, partial [Gemmataceae bacterium]|nr:SUMF1/EgtB/PvdO family nonheme iron enzyme [Gemmataceae bacterium]